MRLKSFAAGLITTAGVAIVMRQTGFDWVSISAMACIYLGGALSGLQTDD